ncbi:hypothetical protein ACH3XW_11245 [Acanthocheilonema viteae]
MKGNIILDTNAPDDENLTKKKTPQAVTRQLLMLETPSGETFDPNNVRHQYPFDSLRQEFIQRLKLIDQHSYQNRNNLLLLIERLSINYSTLTARMISQRNDIIAKKVNEKLIIAPCESKRTTIKNIEFKGGLIDTFDAERINAELEILAYKRELVNTISYRPRDDSLWQEFSEQGDKLANQFGKKLDQAIQSIQEQLESAVIHWRLIIICISIATGLKFKLARFLFCSSRKRSSGHKDIVILPSPPQPIQARKRNIQTSVIRLNTFSYTPENHPF